MLEQKPGLNRAWGDGGGDKRVHVIEDVWYKSGDPWLRCRCGVNLIAHTNRELADAWVAHGGGVLRLWDNDEGDADPPPSTTTQSFKAVAAIGRLGSQCVCTETSDVRDCPNYQLGDENEEEFE